MISLWNRFKLLNIFVRLVRNPNRTDLIFKAVDIVAKDRESNVIKELEGHIIAHDNFRKLYEERYFPVVPTMAELKAMPQGSFGEALLKHLNKNNLTLDIFPNEHGEYIADYATTHIYQDHDLWHVLLGYDVSIEDELALQAFGVAQYRSPLATLIIAGGLLHLLGKDPMRAVREVSKVVHGFERGQKTRFLLGEKIHEMLPRPLAEVRRVCEIAA